MWGLMSVLGRRADIIIRNKRSRVLDNLTTKINTSVPADRRCRMHTRRISQSVKASQSVHVHRVQAAEAARLL